MEWAFAWMVFLGSAVLWRDNEHFRVRWLEDHLKDRKGERGLAVVVELLSLAFLGMMTYYGWKLMIKANDRSPILELSRRLWYFCVPLAGVIMMGYPLRRIKTIIMDSVPSRKQQGRRPLKASKN